MPDIALVALPLFAWEGAITVYTASEWGGNALFCDTDGTLRYDETTVAWIALDKGDYADGRAQCDDLFLVQTADGGQFWARALDAGDFAGKYIADTGQAIVADVPSYHWPYNVEGTLRPARLSVTARLTNYSLLWRLANEGLPRRLMGVD